MAFITTGFGVLLLFASLVIFNESLKRMRRASAKAPPRAAGDGALVRVEGQLRRHNASETLRSPLSETPCLAYCLKIYESKGGHPAHARVLRRTFKNGLGNLLLEDSDSRLYTLEITDFDCKAAEFEDAQNALAPCTDPRAARFLESLQLSTNRFGLRRAMNLHENILREGDFLTVFARIQRAHSERPHLSSGLLTDKPLRTFTFEAIAIFGGAILFASIGIALLNAGLR